MDRFTSGPKLAKEVENKFNKVISSKTVKRYAKFVGFKAMRPKKVPFISKKNKKARLEFAKKFILMPKSYWKKVIWSDESKINLFTSDGITYVWRRAGERLQNKCTLKTVKHNGGSIMVWGCIGENGVGKLCKIEGKMDSLKYIKILQENLLPSVEKLNLSEFVFQQDNDPKHTSKITTKFFAENRITKMEWPAQSPDINIIEHCWAFVKKVYSEDPASNLKEAFIKIKQIWENIPKEFIQKLVDSIYERLSEVIRNKGGATDY